MTIRDAITLYLRKAVPKGTEIEVRVPDENQTAHYATSVAFRLAKEQKKNPREVAEEIVLKLLKTVPAEFFAHAEVAGPGFINFWLSQKTLNGELQRILKEGKKYGSSNVLKSKIQLEFISANPTGPLTLANGRGGFLGDVLGNVLKAVGAKVEKEYYVNDGGNQILTLGKSILAAAGVISYEETFYQGNYVKKWAKKHIQEVKKPGALPGPIGKRAADDFFKAIKTVIEKKAKIKFDRYTSEVSHIYTKGYPEKILQIFKKGGWTYEQDGALWFKTTTFGDDKDRVLITSKDRTPTYLLVDAGHYLETKKRGFDTKINILGPDHYGYVKRIQAVANILKFKKSEVLITQAIRLMRDGHEFKMSKRKGEFITFDDLVDEVGMDSARFFFLMISPETHMDFDMNLAKERSNKNPVFYLQYAYVRTANILKKAGALAGKKADLKLLNTEADVKLIRSLALLPEVLADTANDYQVHRLTRYALELAGDFHNFYEKERVLGELKDVALARYQLVKAANIVFENISNVLGITKLKKM